MARFCPCDALRPVERRRSDTRLRTPSVTSHPAGGVRSTAKGCEVGGGRPRGDTADVASGRVGPELQSDVVGVAELQQTPEPDVLHAVVRDPEAVELRRGGVE